MKKLMFCILFIFGTIFLTSCFWWEKKDLLYYKNVWKDTFKNYQYSTTKIPKKGQFNFELSTMVAGNTEWISGFSNLNFEEKFSSLSIQIFWDHDFENINNPKLSANIKIYLNKRTFWLADVDISIDINWKWQVEYSLNNMNENVLKLFQIKQEDIDVLMASFNENKWKKTIADAKTNILGQIIQTILDSSKESPLKDNSKEEEQKIIESFLNNEVIEVTSWTEKKDNVENIIFKLNWDNTIKFLNDVSKITSTWSEVKNFDGDKELFKSFVIAWDFNISDKKIIDSNINIELPLSAIDEQTWKEKYDLLKLQNQFKMPNPEKFDIDLTTLISSNSTPDNKLQFRVKWMVK